MAQVVIDFKFSREQMAHLEPILLYGKVSEIEEGIVFESEIVSYR